MSVRRFDAGTTLRPSRTTPEGYVVGEAAVSSVGVFPYRRADGSTTFEYRPASEVFATESLATVSSKPITNDHPKDSVNARNAQSHMVGLLGERLDLDEAAGVIRSSYTLTHADAIEAAVAGKRAISPGYDVELDPTPGMFNGQRYDAIQRNIRYNHFAIVDSPRQAGLSLRLDAGDAEQVDVATDATAACSMPQQQRNDTMPKVTLGGVAYEVEEGLATKIAASLDRLDALDKAAANAVGELEAANAKLETVAAERDAERKRADDAAAELAKRADSSADEAARLAWYNDRKRVEPIAARFKLDVAGKTNAELKGGIVAAYMGDSEPMQRTDAAIDAAFAVIEKSLGAAAKANGDFAQTVFHADSNSSGDDHERRMSAANAAYQARLGGAK